jgi:SP family myo-inositol transporter-like MFS transporter 13
VNHDSFSQPDSPLAVPPFQAGKARLFSYRSFLLVIAGLGGLLYGIDIGIISAALLYLSKTVDLSVAQTSAIVAAVLGGSMASSLLAGIVADGWGRKKMMVTSGLLFVSSVVLIVISHSFALLMAGRLLQGLSGGVIAVVVPLYLAETLSAGSRGKGSAIFQFMLTFGIVLAAAVGWYFIRNAEIAIAAAHGNAVLIQKAQDHAWRGMFLSVIYPGILFFLGTFALSETPRWLFRKGRKEAAFASLLRSCGPEEARFELGQMETYAEATQAGPNVPRGSLLQRKYVVPFVLACVILACNQATGINSILGYLAVILKQAGMTAERATQGDFVVKLLNSLMSIVAITLIDRKGRKFLLTLGTSGIIIALSATAFLFHREESHRLDIQPRLQSYITVDRLDLPSSVLGSWTSAPSDPVALTVVYSYGDGDKIATLDSNSPDRLTLEPEDGKGTPTLTIRRAYLSPQPSQSQGWAITLCLSLFIASFAIGPGVVVWLTLSELMPTRIRSVGMGVALLVNQGVSTLIAGAFLPIVTDHGYATMFAGWAACTVIYFITAVFFLPETKGKTLEEIEQSFEAAS